MRHKFACAAAALFTGLVASSQSYALDLWPSADNELGKVNWTGFMISPYFGYEKLNLTGSGADLLKSPQGWRVGSAFGYDYQVPGTQFVVGGAAEMFYAWYEGGELNSSGLQSRMHDFGSVKGKLGYVFDRFLVYGTGGYAFADLEVKNTLSGASDRQLLNGWTAGVGVEWAYNKTFTIRGEVDHTAYGAANFSSLPVAQANLGADINTFKIEFVSRF